MIKLNMWNRGSLKFIRFVNVALMFLIGLIVFTSYEALKKIGDKFGKVDIIFLVITCICGALIYFLKKRNVKSRNIVICLMLVGLIIRLVWVFSINSIPVSDYNGIYSTTYEILNGDFNQLRGTEYYARFPHLTIPLMFASFMRWFFPSSTFIAVKIANCLFSTLGILGIYLLVKEIFKKERYAEIGAFLMAFYPPIILYTAVYCNENQAIPLYIFAIYLFIKYIHKEKSYLGIFLAGITLSIGNLFRMVATIVVAAFILYILVCVDYGAKERLKKGAVLILGFIIPLVFMSFGLKGIGFTEQHLFVGSEPKITNILKGTNIESGGGWTHEDAIIPDLYNFDKEKIEEVCKGIIIERLTKTPINDLINFYYKKYTGIWSNGEFSGAYWAEHSLEDSDMKVRVSQNGIWFMKLFYLGLIVFTFIGLFNFKKIKENKKINLLYFIFCGYGIMFLITERQDRYTFIVCFIFIVLAINGINLFDEKLGESKWKSLD
ncbi:MAG: glycosyltransferase family 39 protein [Clostridium sp.]|uniref:glycosyltransferase family 39 protein n=1 Tax=Clostridium sp. TaxID=1506 RepID=UPI003EE65455